MWALVEMAIQEVKKARFEGPHLCTCYLLGCVWPQLGKPVAAG